MANLVPDDDLPELPGVPGLVPEDDMPELPAPPGALETFARGFVGGLQPPGTGLAKDAIVGAMASGERDPVGAGIARGIQRFRRSVNPALPELPPQYAEGIPPELREAMPQLAAEQGEADIQREVAGEEAHPVADWLGTYGPILAPGAALAARPARRALARHFKAGAEKQTLRALQAPSAVGQMAMKEGELRPGQVARSILDEPGVNLREGPGGVLRASKAAMSQRYGPEMSRLLADAQQKGVGFDLGNVLANFQRAIKPRMLKNPDAAPFVADVEEYLAKQALARGTWTGGRRQLFKLTPQEAHELRQNLDTHLRGVTKTQDPTGTLSKVPFNEVRHLVDSELGQAMAGAGLGDEWAAVNRQYGNMSAAARLSRAGTKAVAAREANPAGSRVRVRVGPMPIPFMTVGGKPAPLRTAGRARINDALYQLLRED
jgi:hypothetical protein